MDIKRIEDYLIDPKLESSIIELIQKSFNDYPEGRSFLHQRPSFRLLAMSDQTQLIGHLAVEHRAINIEGENYRVFGIVDLCVSKEFQKQQIGTALVKKLELLAQQNNIDFLMLLSSEKSYYTKLGFSSEDNPCKWLMIQHGKSLGVARRKLADALMVKKIGSKDWKAGEVDFLGHIF